MTRPKPPAPSNIMGTAGVAARRSKPEESFGAKEYWRNRVAFRNLFGLMKLDFIDKALRREIIELFDDYLGVQALWNEAPRRKVVREELRRFRTTCIKYPGTAIEGLSEISAQALHRLNLSGLTDDTLPKDLYPITEKAIAALPNDKGGRPSNPNIDFLVHRFTQIYKIKHGRASLSNTEHVSEFGRGTHTTSGPFISALTVAASIICNPVPSDNALAQAYKRLFYNAK
jgi:hypothetical protein